MSVEGEAFLKTEGVTATKTGRHDAEFFTSLEDGVPHLNGFLFGDVDFASASSSVTCSGEDDVVDTCEGENLKGVVLHVNDVLLGQFLHGLEGVGSLHGELSPLLALVNEVFAKFHAHLVGDLAHPIPVFVNVGSVGNHEILVVMDAVDEHVINHTTLTIGEAGILHFTIEEVFNVVGGNILHEVLGDRAFGAELAHMADIKNAYVIADIIVFFNKAGVLDRHVVACEFGHLGSKRNVEVCVRGCFHYVNI